MVRFWVAVGLLIPLAAHGQTTTETLPLRAFTIDTPAIITPCLTSGGCIASIAPGHAATGDADLDRAMAICDAHSHQTGATGGQWYQIEHPYAATCATVERQWNTTATAKAAREYAEKQAADKVWLDQYAKTLGAKNGSP